MSVLLFYSFASCDVVQKQMNDDFDDDNHDICSRLSFVRRPDLTFWPDQTHRSTRCLSHCVYELLTAYHARCAHARYDGLIRVSGSLYGRAVGVVMCYMWQSITGTPYPTDPWGWMDPGVMSAIGAAGLLGGVNRIATASTVIVVRYHRPLLSRFTSHASPLDRLMTLLRNLHKLVADFTSYFDGFH